MLTPDDLHRLADMSVHGFLAGCAVGSVLTGLAVKALVEGY